MDTFLSRVVWKLKLALQWWRRILLAEDHFGSHPLRKLRLAFCGGYTLDQHYIYDFDRNRREDYLSEFDWYRSRNINRPYDMMLNNKVIATEVLGRYARVPAALMQRNRGRMVWLAKGRGQGYCSPADAVSLLEERGALFMKPLASGKGKGVFKLEWDGIGPLLDGSPLSCEELEAFLEARDGWFLSEAVEQGEFGRRLFPSSTNTIRFITLRSPSSGRIEPFFAVQRIGTAQTAPVDNGSRGGLVAKIDMETGELSCAKCLQKLGSWDTHPDTGAAIKGAIVPGWQQLKSTMVSLAEQLPFMNIIAWDVLLTDDGPCIIEANTSTGPNIIQLWGPQRHGELGAFYRHHGCIK